jgi:hypothetical protein
MKLTHAGVLRKSQCFEPDGHIGPLPRYSIAASGCLKSASAAPAISGVAATDQSKDIRAGGVVATRCTGGFK